MLPISSRCIRNGFKVEQNDPQVKLPRFADSGGVAVQARADADSLEDDEADTKEVFLDAVVKV